GRRARVHQGARPRAGADRRPGERGGAGRRRWHQHPRAPAARLRVTDRARLAHRSQRDGRGGGGDGELALLRRMLLQRRRGLRPVGRPGVVLAGMATIDDFRAVAARVRNWGRWGDDDQLGTLNLLGPECVREAAGLVQKGAVFPLGVSFDAEGPWSASGYRRNPIHLMTVDGGDEVDFSAHVRGWDEASRGARELGGVWRLGPGRFYDDYIMMPLQSASQRDPATHGSYDGHPYNSY